MVNSKKKKNAIQCKTKAIPCFLKGIEKMPFKFKIIVAVWRIVKIPGDDEWIWAALRMRDEFFNLNSAFLSARF